MARLTMFAYKSPNQLTNDSDYNKNVVYTMS